ncbi:Uncharacterised protein [Mycobacteroides abscessus subsp. abscessus]|nr:Uncharacterised protein [Mycobacteroides abscessus subsp. abscessus]SKV77891.1 Uncharacterised protein [Mycobacteroides abscessus subsp. abscessus]
MSPGLWRWNATVQKVRPHTMTPTTSEATTAQVHKGAM